MKLSTLPVRTPGPAPSLPPNHTPREASDAGWLGQVPPPQEEPAPACPATDPGPAMPWLQPDPMVPEPILPGTDPTLFG